MKKSVYSEDQLILQAMLRDARKAAGLTQDSLAKALGKPQSFVAKYEAGERLLNVIELVTILRVLGARPSVFVDALDTAMSK